MDRIWQWAWDRYGPRYSWALSAISFPILPSIYLIPSFGVVALEKSGHYVEAAAVTVVAVLVCGYVMALPGRRLFRLVEQWAAGHEVERASALEATYTWARGWLPERWSATPLWAPWFWSSSVRSPERTHRG